ncbi:hypothetical protein M758_4G072500 [Ceratodon purpureus]|nr:hypothetical protein M758_4G072500 [Ceratodon purpureus]
MQVMAQVGYQYPAAAGGRVPGVLEAVDGCSSSTASSSLQLHGGGMRSGAMSVKLRCCGSLFLECGRGRNEGRVRRRGAAVVPVIVGCSGFEFPPDALFLGFDSSTQSLKVTAIDSELRLVKTAKVNYDADLKHYGTKDGVHRDPHVKGRYTAPALMWVEALDMMLTKLAEDGFPFHKVYAISGSAQQHGSVFWAQGARDSLLKNLDPSKSLLSQLQNAFATKESPMWMDSTTSAQCHAIEEALGGAAGVTALTGSRSLERYTGPQIRRIYETQEDVYHATERVSLISSFMASLLLGDYAAIDHSDAAGMTLMDLHHRNWSPDALNATAPGLLDKLGPLALPHSIAGKLHPYYVERYNFSPNCQIVTWSGDNPCSLAGLAMTRPGDIAISLGTGDTVFGVTHDSHPGLDGHVFPNPVDPNSYVAMLVHKNGSLSREEVRNQKANGSWEAFNELLDKSPPLNEGKMGFYYKEWESLPPLPGEAESMCNFFSIPHNSSIAASESHSSTRRLPSVCPSTESLKLLHCSGS